MNKISLKILVQNSLNSTQVPERCITVGTFMHGTFLHIGYISNLDFQSLSKNKK